MARWVNVGTEADERGDDATGGASGGDEAEAEAEVAIEAGRGDKAACLGDKEGTWNDGRGGDNDEDDAFTIK